MQQYVYQLCQAHSSKQDSQVPVKAIDPKTWFLKSYVASPCLNKEKSPGIKNFI